jgi:hypothetical protein
VSLGGEIQELEDKLASLVPGLSDLIRLPSVLAGPSKVVAQCFDSGERAFLLGFSAVWFFYPEETSSNSLDFRTCESRERYQTARKLEK